MKLTNADLQNLANAIALAGLDGDKPRNLPWKVAYALARTSEALKAPLQAIDAARKSIFAEHAGGKDKSSPGDPGHEKLVKAMQELMAVEVEVSVHRFKLADIEGVTIAPHALVALLPLIDEPQDKPATP
jgi:hypothetical protein